jgi:hypothetical protein
MPKETKKNIKQTRESITIKLPEKQMLQLQGIASGFGVTPEMIAQRWILKQLESMEEPGKITHAMREQQKMLEEEDLEQE